MGYLVHNDDAPGRREFKAATLEEMQSEVRANNEAHGWYVEDRAFGDDIALLHTEVSEAFEAFREWGLEDATGGTGGPHAADCATTDLGLYRKGATPGCTCGFIPKPEGVGSELADVFIRLLDTCDRHGIDLPGEYVRKMAFNRTRPYKHGKRL